MGLLSTSNNYVTLIHLTAYEYLKDRFEQQPLALDCLTYLGYHEISSGPCQSVQDMQRRTARLPFLDYTAKYWHHHISSEEIVIEMILPIIDKEAHLASITQAFYYHHYPDPSLRTAVFEKIPTSRTALHAASVAGLPLILSRLLERGKIVETDSEGHSPLHLAAMFGNNSCVRALIQDPSIKKQILHMKDKTGWTALFWAVMKNHLSTTELLVKEGTDVSIVDSHGWSVLDWAAFKDEPDILEALLTSTQWADLGVYKNWSKYGGSYSDPEFRWREMPEQIPRVLKILASQDNYEIFHDLVSHFDDLGTCEDEDARRRGRSKRRHLHHANCHGQLEHIIESITRARSCGPHMISKFNRQESSLMTGRFTVRLLDYVIRTENIQILEFLLQTTNCLEDFSNNDSWRRTPMHIAAFNQDSVVSRVLHRHGAAISQDGNGVTPLQIACRVGSREVVEFLLPLSDVDSSCLKHIWHNFRLLGHHTIKPMDEFGQNTRRQELRRTEFITYTQLQDIYAAQNVIAEKLLQSRADAQEALADSWVVGNLQGIRLLLSNKASLEKLDSTGRSLLHYCAGGVHPPCLTDENSQTPMPKVDSEEIKPISLQTLIDLGASVNGQSEDGRTALHYALVPFDYYDLAKEEGCWYSEEWHEPEEIFRTPGSFTRAEVLLRNKADSALCSNSGLNGFHFLAASPGLTDDQTLALFNLMTKDQSIQAEANEVRQLKIAEVANPTPTRVAILFGHIALVDELVKSGTELPEPGSMTRAFERAIERRDGNALLWLYQTGFKASSSILFTFLTTQSYYLGGYPSLPPIEHAQALKIFDIILNHNPRLQECITERDRWGSTVLHDALSRYCPVSMIEQLIKHGADMMAKNTAGKLPIQAAWANLKRSEWKRNIQAENIRCVEQAMIQQRLIEKRNDGELYMILTGQHLTETSIIA